MKFLCEQCKAKYQIADEKAAGRTVRMKCRKCGHLIEVRAAVTESSASSVPPQGPTAPGAPNAPKGGIPRPSNKPAAPAGRGAPLATSLASARPANKPEGPAGALAGAFKSTVQREEEVSAPFDMSELSPSDEWYVAINGVPVGPVRVGEVRRKAALGAVTEESLCWQEGLDEWRPVRSFPELAAIVREAAVSGRTSLTPPPPEARPSMALAQARAPSARPAAQPVAAPRPPARPAPTAPAPTAPAATAPAATAAPTATAPHPPARSNVVPITSRLAVAEKLAEAPEDLTVPYVGPPITADSKPVMAPAAVVPDPFAMPPLAVMPSAKPATEPAPASGLAAAAPVTAPSSAELSTPSARARKSPPWMAIAMVASAMAFGVTTAIAIFLRPAQQVVVQVPVPTAPAAPTSSSAPAVAAAPTTIDSAAPPPTTTVATTPRAVAMGGSKVPAASSEPRHGPIDLHGLMGGTSISPTDDPGSEGPRAPGQCFSSGQVQQVIGLHQVGIRRACWERNPTTKPTVNVSVSLTIAPDGSAQNVSANADEASVAHCVENDVRAWHFPAMGCSQQTSFSFHFVRQ